MIGLHMNWYFLLGSAFIIAGVLFALVCGDVVKKDKESPEPNWLDD